MRASSNIFFRFEQTQIQEIKELPLLSCELLTQLV